MTREGILKHKKVFKAWLKGAKIEYFSDKQWWDIPDPDFREEMQYRIKPEPEYIPFTFEDAEQLIGKTIKSKSGNSIYIITAINYEYIGIWKNNINYDQLFDIYTFLDGSPCGKLKQ